MKAYLLYLLSFFSIANGVLDAGPKTIKISSPGSRLINLPPPHDSRDRVRREQARLQSLFKQDSTEGINVPIGTSLNVSTPDPFTMYMLR